MTGLLIGDGTYGSVYEEEWEDQTLAFKVFFDDETLIREADIMFRLKHPCLVRGYAIVSRDQEPELFEDRLGDIGIFQTLADGNLSQLFEQMDELNLDRQLVAERLLEDLCQATTALARSGYYHMDIKPDNILYLLTEGDVGVRFLLCDYGICMRMTRPYDGCDNKVFEKDYSQIGTRGFLPVESSIPHQGRVYADFQSVSWQIALSVLSVLNGDCIIMEIAQRNFESLSTYKKIQVRLPEYLSLAEGKMADILTQMLSEPGQRLTPLEVLSALGEKEILAQCPRVLAGVCDQMDMAHYSRGMEIDYRTKSLALFYASISYCFDDNFPDLMAVFLHIACLFYQVHSPVEVSPESLVSVLNITKCCLCGF